MFNNLVTCNRCKRKVDVTKLEIESYEKEIIIACPACIEKIKTKKEEEKK